MYICMCVCVCVCVCVCACVCVCIHIHIYIYTHTHQLCSADVWAEGAHHPGHLQKSRCRVWGSGFSIILSLSLSLSLTHTHTHTRAHMHTHLQRNFSMEFRTNGCIMCTPKRCEWHLFFFRLPKVYYVHTKKVRVAKGWGITQLGHNSFFLSC